MNTGRDNKWATYRNPSNLSQSYGRKKNGDKSGIQAQKILNYYFGIERLVVLKRMAEDLILFKGK